MVPPQWPQSTTPWSRALPSRGGRAPPWVLLEASWRWLDRKLCRLMEPGCWSWLTVSQRPRDCSMLRERMKPSASVHRSAFTRPDTQAPT